MEIRMKFAVCSWMPDFSNRAIEDMKANGVKAVEPGPSFLLNEDEADFRTQIERLKNNDIRIYSCHSPFSSEIDLSALDEDMRKAAVATQIRCLAGAAMAGANCIVIHAGNKIQNDQR